MGKSNPKLRKERSRIRLWHRIFPIGFRLQWRSNTRIRPFLEAKGGMLGFTKKAPATQATYENFSLQSMGGVQVKVDDRWGVRLGLFGDFHFSNAFIVPPTRASTS